MSGHYWTAECGCCTAIFVTASAIPLTMEPRTPIRMFQTSTSDVFYVEHADGELSQWGPLNPYTGCPRRNVRDFGRVFLMLNYTDITQTTYVQSRTVTEIMAREKCGRHRCRNTVRRPWRHICPMRLPDQRDNVMQWPWRVCYSTVALTSQDNRSAATCVKYLEV